MAKIYIISLVILLTNVVAGATQQGNLTRLCVEQTYTSQIGVRELTGKNDGKEVEMYLASVNAKKGAAWCAAFVNWVLVQCGVKTPKSAWSPSWFSSRTIIYTINSTTNMTTLAKGDVFGIFYANKNRIAHVGIIDQWGETYVKTVEGNTNGAGSREGNGVYRKVRLRKQIYQVARFIEN